MDLIIERLNGEVFNTADYGLKFKTFNISPPVASNQSDTVRGRDGSIDQGTQYDPRTIEAEADFWAEDYYDYPLLRNEIFKLFQSKEAFYVTDTREPAKRWLVKVDGGYDVEQVTPWKGELGIEFITVDQPFAESIGTSLNPRRFDEEIWQIGQGLVDEVQDTDYIHSTTSFQIYNSSDIIVDPRVHEIKITFSGISNNLAITNATTGDVFTYSGSTSEGDTIELDGIKMLKNGQSIFRDTNHGLITLAPGYNDFLISGANDGDFEITFEFRFYYF